MLYQVEWEDMLYDKYFKGTRSEVIKAKKFVREVKSRSRCICCGESRPWCLQYHHRDKDKKFMGVHAMASKGFPIGLIKEEIHKCDCLCANDHQEVHYRQYWINI